MKLISGKGPMVQRRLVSRSAFSSPTRGRLGEIANEVQVTEVTTRNRYKELSQRMEFNIQL